MIFKECPSSLLNILNLVKFVKLIIQIFLQLLKSTILFTFKIVKIPSRKSNQYKVVFTEISESSFNCSFIDQYYVPQAEKWCFTLNLLAQSQKPAIRHISKQFNEFIPQNQKWRFGGHKFEVFKKQFNKVLKSVQFNPNEINSTQFAS
ncbi:Hypothetical_protein [Hexamita inflata]|uniref:Hypothetical_protein n=1 Tax=Hexamita inflata TaxID=28002 RepID=A0AA86R9J1_9EUKA|nr:Hypothetical protein HINF_LOCUS61969 [Hexamita inflata]